MKTECSQGEFRFEGPGRREIVARFDGGTISSDGGALLLSEVERRTGIMARFARCFRDQRDPRRVEHGIGELVSQRVLGLCLGYEDLVDHDGLRTDPLLCALAGKSGKESLLAGKSTLSRLELSRADSAPEERYKRIALDTAAVDQLLVQIFLDGFKRKPRAIVLDLDATDFELHGRQEGRFFHGFYDHYCYLPLYVICGEHVLCARLRPSNIDASEGSVEELDRIVRQIRARFPDVAITIRADSGFCREPIMAWCEANRVGFVLGLARNERLLALSAEHMEQAKRRCEKLGGSQRVYGELRYRTLTTWSRSRRVVLRAEHSERGDNPRYVVTSLKRKGVSARTLYEDLYCARGDMENRIKEQQLDLFAGRVSAPTLLANQVRLYFATIAYQVLQALRRLGLKGTALEHAQCGTIRLRLLKIGAQIRISVRKLWVSLSQAFPLQGLFAAVLAKLRTPAPSG